MVVGGLQAGRRPARDAHRPAADHRRGQERHGVGQVGLHLPVPRRDRARGDLPAVRRLVVDLDPGLPQHRHRHRDVRRRRHRRAGVHDRQPVGERGARTAAARTRTATTPTRRSRRCRRAPTRCRSPRTAWRRRRRRRRGCAAQSSSGGDGPRPGLLVAVERRPRPASAATGGTNRSTVPASPQSTRAPGGGGRAHRDGQLGAASPSTVEAERAHRADIRSVSRLRRAPLMVDGPAPGPRPVRPGSVCGWSAISIPAPSHTRVRGRRRTAPSTSVAAPRLHPALSAGYETS